MIQLTGYRSISEIRTKRHAICRATRETDGLPVILKAGRPEEMAKFAHEYEMTRRLKHVFGVVRVLENPTNREVPFLVFEDFGGESADRLLRRDFPPTKRLSAAIRIARILKEIHAAGVVHRNISASTVTVNPRNGLVKIGGFGRSARMGENAGSDVSDDLRSLGDVCHELFAADPVPKTAVSDSAVRSRICGEGSAVFNLGSAACQRISDVVVRLLRDRYPTAADVEKDLKACLATGPGVPPQTRAGDSHETSGPHHREKGRQDPPESIRPFLESVSHDVRTPMNGVFGMTDILLHTELTDDQRGFVETIRSSALTLSDVINEVFDFSEEKAEKIRCPGISAQTEGAPPGDIRKPKVLLVEDNLTNQKVSLTILEKLGCQTDLAPEGRTAVRMIRKNRYDVVFMDCQMPIMDGFRATRAIRKWENAKSRLPIVAMTANAMKGDREKCLDAGMDDYIPKPIRLDRIREALKRFCGLGAGSASPSLKVLLANDDPEILSAIGKAVRKARPDASVKSVSGGVEACTLIGSFLPDILIIDLIMPDMDSMALFRFLHNHERYGKIRLIPITDLDENSVYLREIRNLDIGECIRKPWDADGIADVIRRTVGGKDDASASGIVLPEETETRDTRDPILNPMPIFETIGGDIDIIHEFVDIFLDDVPSEIKKMERAMRSGDIEKTGRFAHGIKGAAGDIGGCRLHRVAWEIEHAAREKKVATCREKVVKVRHEFTLLREALERQDWKLVGHPTPDL